MRIGRNVLASLAVVLLVLALTASCANCPVHRALFGSGSDQKPESGSAAPAAPETAQKTCPVMGGPINPGIYTEYKGRKVYFCCPACIKTFEEAPAKYLDKLPPAGKGTA